MVLVREQEDAGMEDLLGRGVPGGGQAFQFGALLGCEVDVTLLVAG
jgi:hypothetical protein